jgi:tetratricopeptide (TPR) repeat protein
MSHRKFLVALVVFVLFALAVAPAQTYAQTDENVVELMKRANDLMEQNNYTEALPVLEKIAKLRPDDGKTQFFLGFALIGQAINTKDNAARKALRVRARSAFMKAKTLGFTEPRLEALIQSLPEDGSDGAAFSSNPAADALIKEGEGLLTQGKSDEALKKYQQALELDPKLLPCGALLG